MSLHDFLASIQEGGRLRVPPPPANATGSPPNDLPPPDLVPVVEELDARSRLELPAGVPPLRLAAALWAARLLYRACQALAYRDVSAEQVTAYLQEPCPEPPSPAVCYSADLILQHLPQIIALARGRSEGDPLVAGLTRLAKQWPLSSVGVKGIEAADLTTGLRAFAHDPCLRRLYADRIVERADLARLHDADAREAVREGLGLYPSLAPAIAKALESSNERDSS